VHLQRELVTRTGMDPGRIEDVIIGCASQNAEQGANIARTATMLAGWVVPPARIVAS
jgi:acetyl-CoA C-acetyltransferase